MPDLCDLDELKIWLQIEDSDSDDLLQRLITSTSAAFMREIRRNDFAPDASFTDRLIGSGTCELYLKHYPINSVSTVTVNGTDIDESDGTTTGWLFDDSVEMEARQKLIYVGGFWPQPCWNNPNIVIQYNAGYTDIPDDVSQAVIEWIGWIRGYSQLQSQDQSEVSWQQIGQWQQSITAGKSTLQASGLEKPLSVQNAIERYMRSPL